MPYESIYRSVLEAVETRLASLAADGEALEGWRVTLRKEPSLVPEQDALPQVVIAPARNLGQIPQRKTFGAKVAMGFEVIVGVFVHATWAVEDLWKRMHAMEQIRKNLWDVALAEGVASDDGGFDVEYQPAFFEGGAPPPNCDGNWMKFRYVVKADRTTATGR